MSAPASNLLWRLVEDKMGQLGLALRDLRIPIDCSELHGNSERPLFFHGWLAIPDSTLPAKGVGYRRNTNEESRDLSAVAVNIFSQSDLWKLQGLPLENVPRAVCEGDFCVPSPKSFLISADSRHNLTDTQETAQWIAGEDVFSKLIKSAFGGLALMTTLLYFLLLVSPLPLQGLGAKTSRLVPTLLWGFQDYVPLRPPLAKGCRGAFHLLLRIR